MGFTLSFRGHPDDAGPVFYAPIPWDSELVGVPFFALRHDPDRGPGHGRALAELVHDVLPRPSITVTKVPARDIAAIRVLTAHGFYPVETMMHLHAELARTRPLVPRLPRGFVVRSATPEDLKDIVRIATEGFADDRFHLDPAIPDTGAGTRYRHWVERAAADGDPLFVLDRRDGPDVVGFYHVREIDEATIDLSLAAVDDRYQRLGLGAVMYQEVLRICQDRGYRTAETNISVQNTAVLNLFAALGFAFRSPVLTLHHSHDRQEP